MEMTHDFSSFSLKGRILKQCLSAVDVIKVLKKYHEVREAACFYTVHLLANNYLSGS